MRHELMFTFGLLIAMVVWIFLCIAFTGPISEEVVELDAEQIEEEATENYMSILQRINYCGTTSGLSVFFDEADDFYCRYQDVLSRYKLEEFHNNIIKEITQRRNDLLMIKRPMFS